MIVRSLLGTHPCGLFSISSSFRRTLNLQVANTYREEEKAARDFVQRNARYKLVDVEEDSPRELKAPKSEVSKLETIQLFDCVCN